MHWTRILHARISSPSMLLHMHALCLGRTGVARGLALRVGKIRGDSDDRLEHRTTYIGLRHSLPWAPRSKQLSTAEIGAGRRSEGYSVQAKGSRAQLGKSLVAAKQFHI